MFHFNPTEFQFLPATSVFKDYETVANTRYFNYKSQHLRPPLVIDNGSFSCRAGWALAKEGDPRFEFRSLVGKIGKRDSKTKKNKTVEANDAGQFVCQGIPYSELPKFNAKSPFDDNIVYQFDLQEIIFDHIFSSLSVSHQLKDHPLFMTHALCNPYYSKQIMTELLFECYGFPSVFYEVDMIASCWQNYEILGSPKDILLIGSGFTTTHLLPIVDMQSKIFHSKRISLGGYHGTELLQKTFQLKYPNHKLALTPEACEHFKQKHCYVAPDYISELDKYKNCEKRLASGIDDQKPKNLNNNNNNNNNNYNNNKIPEAQVITYQLPFTPNAVPQLSQEEIEKRIQRRKEQGQRLREMSARRKLKKETEKKEKLELYQKIKKMKSLDKQNKALQEAGLFNMTQLDAAIKELTESLEGDKTKDLTAEDKQAKKEEEKRLYPLIKVPDDVLSNHQKREKKVQILLKYVRDSKEKCKDPTEQQALEKQEKMLVGNPNEYVGNLHKRRKVILESKEQRDKLSQQTTKGRETVRKQKRMAAVMEAAFEDNNKGDDAFGERDEDWDVYLKMADEPDSSEERENEELVTIEGLLEKCGEPVDTFDDELSEEAEHQVRLSVDRIRLAELPFQPSIIGVNQMGIPEALFHILQQFPEPIRQRLCNAVFVTGGNAAFPGFETRIKQELQMWRPIDTPVKLFRASDPLRDAWRGGRRFVLGQQERFLKGSLWRSAYEECGVDYLTENHSIFSG